MLTKFSPWTSFLLLINTNNLKIKRKTKNETSSMCNTPIYTMILPQKPAQLRRRSIWSTSKTWLSPDSRLILLRQLSPYLYGGRLANEVDERGLLARAGKRGPWIVVPKVWRSTSLYVTHYAKRAGHPDGRDLYYLIHRNLYRPALAVDFYATVRRCPQCEPQRIKLGQNVAELQIFPAEAPFESVCIDIWVNQDITRNSIPLRDRRQIQ